MSGRLHCVLSTLPQLVRTAFYAPSEEKLGPVSWVNTTTRQLVQMAHHMLQNMLHNMVHDMLHIMLQDILLGLLQRI